MEFFWNPNTKYTENVNAPFFWCFVFSQNIVYHIFLSWLASRIHPFKDASFHTVLSLSRMLFEFSLTLYSTMYGKTFSIYGVHTSKNVWNTLLLMSLFSTQNSKQRFLKSVSIKTKGVEKTMICFFKIQSENMRKTWDVGLFIFSIIYNQNIYDKLKTDYYQGNKIKIYQCSKKLVTERIEMLIQTPSRLSFRFSWLWLIHVNRLVLKNINNSFVLFEIL